MVAVISATNQLRLSAIQSRLDELIKVVAELQLQLGNIETKIDKSMSTKTLSSEDIAMLEAPAHLEIDDSDDEGYDTDDTPAPPEPVRRRISIPVVKPSTGSSFVVVQPNGEDYDSGYSDSESESDKTQMDARKRAVAERLQKLK